MSWYMTNGEMSWYPAVGGDHGCVFHGTAGVDIVNFAGDVSFDICKFGHGWSAFVNKSSLIVLLGAGGALIYFWQKSLNNSPDAPPRIPRLSARSFMKWLFAEELVEDWTDDTSHVHGYYFGPSLSNNQGNYSSNDADEESSSDCLSLNSLSAKSSPCKFLKKPFLNISCKGNTARLKDFKHDINCDNSIQITNPCPKCEKGTCRLKKHQLPKISSNSSSCYSGSPKTQLKSTTPDLLSSEEEKILQRTVASNKLTYRYYGPGFDLRMKGDGSDQVAEMDNTTPVTFRKGQNLQKSRLYVNTQQRAQSGKSRWSLSPASRSRVESCSSSPACGDTSCTDPQCYGLLQMARDYSLDSITDQSCSINGSMMDLVQNAKEARRLIREISFDSQASDLDLELSFTDYIVGNTAKGSSHLCNRQLINNCDFIEDDIASLPGESKLMSSQSSVSGLSELADQSDMKGQSFLNRESSIPDFQTLQKNTSSNKDLWKLTGFTDLEGSIFSDPSDTENASLEWESLDNGWHSKKLYKPYVDEVNISDSLDERSSFDGSSLDLWEWDSDCLSQSLDTTELDLQTDLEKETSKSRRSSTEKDMRFVRRLPPSGRSSLERESMSSRLSESDDITLTSAKSFVRSKQINMGLNPQRSRSNSTSRNGSGSLSPLDGDLPFEFNSSNNKERLPMQMNVSAYSEESGFLDYEGSMDSSMCSMNSSVFTSSINLSPVKEAKEPQSPTGTTSSFMESPEYGFGSLSSSDTVIKISQPDSQIIKHEPQKSSRDLFLSNLNTSRTSKGTSDRKKNE